MHIPEDSQLLIEIRKCVSDQLMMSKKTFRIKLWTKFIIYFAAVVLSYFSLYTVTNPIFFVLTFMLFGIVSLSLIFNFAHDFSHNTIFKSKRLNEFFFAAMFTLVGAHAEAWRKRHVNEHHHAPNVEGYDSDLEISKLIRVTPNGDYFWYHKFQHLYAPLAYTIYSLFWIFVKDFVLLFSSESKNASYFVSFGIQKLTYLTFIVIIPIFFSNQTWDVVLLSFVAMHLFMSLFLLFTFFITHHVETTDYPVAKEDGFINASWLMNQVRSSNDVYPFSKSANFIFGGFNNHVAHHLFPNIHHIHYPQISRIIYGVLKAHGIAPNQTSYLGGIFSHLRLLKRRGNSSHAATKQSQIRHAQDVAMEN